MILLSIKGFWRDPNLDSEIHVASGKKLYLAKLYFDTCLWQLMLYALTLLSDNGSNMASCVWQKATWVSVAEIFNKGADGFLYLRLWSDTLSLQKVCFH